MDIAETLVVQKLTPHQPTLFDVGANVGDWTNMALKYRPQCTLHAFEPSNAGYKYRARYNADNIHFNHCAVSDQDSHITLYEHTTEAVYSCMIPQAGHIAKIVHG
jgi:FkbM family methyltransferase